MLKEVSEIALALEHSLAFVSSYLTIGTKWRMNARSKMRSTHTHIHIRIKEEEEKES